MIPRYRCFYRGKMYMVQQLTMYADGSFGPDQFQGESWAVDSEHASPLMMSTGILDASGKEIFELDIRREEEEQDHGDVVFWYICVWIKELAMFSWLTQTEYDLYTSEQPFDNVFEGEDPYPMNINEASLYKVVGNIYTKPHFTEL